VQGIGTPINQLLQKLRDLRPSGPFLTQSLDLLGSRELASKEQPEKTLGEGFSSTLCGGQFLLAFWDGEVAETDTLVGVEYGPFPNQSLNARSGWPHPLCTLHRLLSGGGTAHLDTPHPAISLINGDLPKALPAMSSSDSFHVFDLLGDDLGHSVLERPSISCGGRSEGPRQ